jgi:hypothetical protein
MQNEQNGMLDQPEAGKNQPKPYHAPKLVGLGSIQTLVQAGVGSSVDHGGDKGDGTAS